MSRVNIVFTMVIGIQLLFNGIRGMAQDVCGTPHLTDAQLTLQEKLLSQRTRHASARLAASQLQYVPIRFHVVRRDDGTGGVDLSSLNQALVLLNQLYLPAGIAYYLCGSQPHYINSTALFDYDNSEESTLADANDVFNAINIYLTNTISFAGSQVGGYTYFPASVAITNRSFVKASQLTGYTLAHELGHYFNLYHTFQSNKSSNVASRELVIRSGDLLNGRPFPANCTSAGDFVCDTPADPYGIPGATVSGCTYSGTIVDANGDFFAPSTTNIMSYYVTCDKPNLFTPGQYARIANGLSLRLDPGNQYSLSCINSSVVSPTGLTASLIPQGARLQFSYPGTDAAGFLIERSLEPTANFSVVGSLPPGSFSFTDGSLNGNTTYYYRVKASNATTQYSAVQRLDVGLFYCLPMYLWPVGNFIPKIDDFILKGSQATLRSVATGAGNAGYSDFTATPLNVLSGHVYSFTASAVTGNFGTFINQHLSIWLDSNRDGLFSNTEMLFQSSASQLMNPVLTGTIAIPTVATSGSARLRVRSQYAPEGLVESACDAYDFGEAEDYTLFIDSPIPPACFTLSASVTPVHCAGNKDGAVTLTLSGGTSPFSYSLANQSNATGTFSALAAGSYTAIVTDANACSRSMVVTVDQPVIAIASLTGSTAVCGAQPVILNVTIAGAGSPYQLQLSNGLSASTITGYVSGTPILVFPDHTTTYQLQSLTDAGNCSVSLVSAAVTVTVNQAPQATISPQNTSLCSGQSFTLTASSGSQYQWNTAQTSSSLVVTTSGTYAVTITSASGCTSIASSSVVVINCARSILFRAKILLAGFTSTTTGLMHTLLVSSNLLPKQQPYSASPWLYTGSEQVTTFPTNVADWVLVMARNASNVVIARRAVFVRNDGILLSPDGTEGVLFTAISEPIYVSIHHRNHLAILSNNAIVDNQLIDFTTDATMARGAQPLIQVGSKLAMYAGDYDANDIINSTDFNKWKVNASTVGRYLPIDGDGNGIVNNQDFNRWMLNRSKIGTPGL